MKFLSVYDAELNLLGRWRPTVPVTVPVGWCPVSGSFNTNVHRRRDGDVL